MPLDEHGQIELKDREVTKCPQCENSIVFQRVRRRRGYKEDRTVRDFYFDCPHCGGLVHNKIDTDMVELSTLLPSTHKAHDYYTSMPGQKKSSPARTPIAMRLPP
jgi:uncharacterized Zn finger protein